MNSKLLFAAGIALIGILSIGQANAGEMDGIANFFKNLFAESDANKPSITLLTVVPPSLQVNVEATISAQLQAISLTVLEAELKKIVEVIKKFIQDNKSRKKREMPPAIKDLIEQLKAAAPQLTALIQKIIDLAKAKFEQFKAKLSPEALKFVNELIDLIAEKVNNVIEQVKKLYNALDKPPKQDIVDALSATSPALQDLFNIPKIQVALGISVSVS